MIGGGFVMGILVAIFVKAVGMSSILLIYAIYIPLIIFNILALIKRSHDMGWSGWTVLIAMFIPLAVLIWMFKAGTDGENAYGAPPPPNTTGVKVLGILFPVMLIAIMGILAAVSIPAYQKYKQRAEQAQHRMHQQH